jgi:transposase-like protein
VGNGEIIAATKLAHELGHVKYTASLNAAGVALYQQQRDLAPEYSRIGRGMYELEQLERRAKDPAEKADVQALIAERRKLMAEIATEMGGNPDALRTGREHRAEVNTIPYLQERLGSKMPAQVKGAIAEFQRTHPGW